MITDCPRCSAPVPWPQRLLGLSPWRCRRCDALLRRRTPTPLAATVIFFSVMLGAIAFGVLTPISGPDALACIVGLAVIAVPLVVLTLAERCIVAWPGRHCCRDCGYDLTGNTTRVCPECGRKAGGA